MWFERLSDCKFVPADSDALDGVPLPLGEIELVRTGTALSFTYRHREYTLGFCRAGTLQGFRGRLKPGSVADIAILKVPGGFFEFHIFERRFTSEAEIDGEMARYAQPACRPSVKDDPFANYRPFDAAPAPFMGSGVVPSQAPSPLPGFTHLSYGQAATPHPRL